MKLPIKQNYLALKSVLYVLAEKRLKIDMNRYKNTGYEIYHFYEAPKFIEPIKKDIINKPMNIANLPIKQNYYSNLIWWYGFLSLLKKVNFLQNLDIDKSSITPVKPLCQKIELSIYNKHNSKLPYERIELISPSLQLFEKYIQIPYKNPEGMIKIAHPDNNYIINNATYDGDIEEHSSNK